LSFVTIELLTLAVVLTLAFSIILLAIVIFLWLKNLGRLQTNRPNSTETAEALLQKRNQEFNILYEAGKELGKTLDLVTIYRTLYQVVSNSMPCTTLIVSTFDNETKLITCAYVNYLGEEHDTSGFPPIELNDIGQGIQSDAIHFGESMLINDFEKRIRETTGKYYIDEDGEVLQEQPDEDDDITRSALIIPIKLNNLVHGVIQIQSNLLNAYTEDHMRLLDALGPQVAAASNNAHLFAQAQHEIAERIRAQESETRQRVFAEALRDTAVSLNTSFNLDTIVSHLIENVAHVIPYDGINLVLFEAGAARFIRLHGIYSKYISVDDLVSRITPLTDIPNFAKLVETKESILIHNSKEEKDWVEVPQLDWIKSTICAPIILNDEVIGSLNVDSATSGFFTPKHVKRLQAFANYMGVAIQHTRLYHELEAQNELLEDAVAARTAELQHAMEQVNVILSNSPDSILMLDTEGNIITHNPASWHMFGWDHNQRPEQLQRCLANNGEINKLAMELKKVLHKAEPTRFNSIGKRTDNTHFDAEIALSPIRKNGIVENVICSIHDISTLKEVERMKDAFVSNVSHELRTPIASLRLHADLIQRAPHKTPTYLSRISREINRLNTLIEDLLNLSRLDQNRVQINLLPLHLDYLVIQYVTDRQPLAEEKGLIIDYNLTNSLPLVRGDAGLIGQVLSILLTNAINYTPENGRITLTTSTKEEDHQTWTGLSVVDTGLGIPKEEQSKIFERFYRGTTGQESGAPGTGLGLSIAQEIVASHHGKIEVKSEGIPGKGTTFTIWLPTFAISDRPQAANPTSTGLPNGKAYLKPTFTNSDRPQTH
jgi:PAS domain S-box-containing protein